jgi:hypothetical protein
MRMEVLSRTKRQKTGVDEAQATLAQTVWWINPSQLFLVFIIPLYTLVFLMPTLVGEGAVVLRFRLFFTGEYYFLGLAFLLLATIWAGLIAKLNVGYPRSAPHTFRVTRVYLDILAILTVTAYCILFYPLALNPTVLLNVLTGVPGAVSHAKWIASGNPGVTSLIQLGVAYVILYLHERWVNRRPLPPRYTLYCLAILALALFRAVVRAERLALIEVLLPMVVMFVTFRLGGASKLIRLVTSLAPFVGVVGLVIFFGATEFLRSWGAYYQYHSRGFVEFVVTRITTYYFTALNNGAGLLAMLDWPTWQFEYLLLWLHRFPFGVGSVSRAFVDYRGSPLFLERYADPEFNNTSGIFPVFFDLGLPGGLVYAAVWGALMGYTYRGFILKRGFGSLFFPAAFVSMLEVMRILYLADPRMLPVMLGLTVGYVFFRQPERVGRFEAAIGLDAKAASLRN